MSSSKSSPRLDKGPRFGSSNGSIRSVKSVDDRLLSSITEGVSDLSGSDITKDITKTDLHKSPLIPQTEGTRSNWWFWNSNNTQVEVTEIRPSISEDPQPNQSWTNWFSSYSDSMMGYVYKQPDETTPLLTETQSNKSNTNTDTNWVSWLWTAKPHEEENYENYTNDVKLYKSAKNAIENSKDSSCLAYKGTIHSQFLINDHELAVYGTETEDQPVKYNIKRTPVIPAEVQENAIIITKSNSNLVSTSNGTRNMSNGIKGSSNGTKSPSKSPNLTSSNASISSINEDIPSIMPNKVIPDINENFRTITFLTKFRLLGQKILFQHNSSENHLYKASASRIIYKKVSRIKRIVIIGVHGFLPPKFVKSMIGQHTGSSIKLIEEATKAVKNWLDDIKEPGFENMYNIDTIALEGQGTIDERVEKSLKLLINWKEIINDCDFLWVVGHGQGSIISIELLSSLLNDKKYRLNDKKLGLLTMAGPLLGPIKGLDSKIVIRAYTTKENEVLNELMQLSNPNSIVFQQLHKCLEHILKKNVKVTLTGSMNDQLVPLHSALGNNFYHPNLFRCIFIDSDSKIPPFIVSLYKLILITRNIGHLEHGLFKDLSERSIGTIYDGTFNKIFNDGDIYLTSIKFALESTNLTQSKDLKFISHHNDSLTPNPTTPDYLYKVPWSVRELVQDILQTKHITNYKLVNTLIKDYQTWEPIKAWKEYKYALEVLSDLDMDDLIV